MAEASMPIQIAYVYTVSHTYTEDLAAIGALCLYTHRTGSRSLLLLVF